MLYQGTAPQYIILNLHKSRFLSWNGCYITQGPCDHQTEMAILTYHKNSTPNADMQEIYSLQYM